MRFSVKNISGSDVEIILAGRSANGVPNTFRLRDGREQILDIDPKGAVLKAMIAAGLIVITAVKPDAPAVIQQTPAAKEEPK